MRIKLNGVKNIRNFVGIKRADGSVFTSDKYIRSSNLHTLTDEDMKVLFEDMNVRTVIDLRTPKEIAEKPDRIPEGVEYISIPVLSDSTFGITHEEGQEDQVTIPNMPELYRGLVTDEISVQGFRRVFEVLRACENKEGAVLWHCTEGKDRCGLTSAMFLALNGVAWKTILKEYLMTKRVSRLRSRKYFWLVLITKRNWKMALAVRKVFDVDASYLKAAFNEINKRYGSVRGFLTNGTDDTI